MMNKSVGAPDRSKITVQNAESATDLEVGTPVCFVMDGAGDGDEVVLPNTGGAAKATTLLAGVVVEKNIPYNRLPKRGVVQIYGVCNTTKIVRQTRAASTDTWQTQAAYAIGDRLVVDTANNAFSRSDAGAQSVAMAGVAAAQSLASVASAASNATDTRTAITAHIKTFLRLG